MKKLIFHTLFLVLALAIVNSAQAQFNYKKKAGPATKDTIATKPVEAPVSVPVVSTVAVDTNIKSTKTIDTTMVGGFNANNKKSLRPNYAFFSENNKRKAVQERTPLAYEHLREEDALFSEFIWEEIDGVVRGQGWRAVRLARAWLPLGRCARGRHQDAGHHRQPAGGGRAPRRNPRPRGV